MKIVENLRSPVLQFGIGGGVLLLLAAGIVTDNRAPIYVAAIVIVVLAALAVYAWMKRGSVFAARVKGKNIRADAGAVIGGQAGGAPPQVFKPGIDADGDIIAGPGAVIGGFSAGSEPKSKG